MQRLLAGNATERQLMAMGAVFIEEHQVLEELFDLLRGDIEDIEVSAEAHDFVIEHLDHTFFRLDMNFPEDMRGECLDSLREMWGVADRDQALRVLHQLRTQGHRAKFLALQKSTGSLPRFKEIFKFDFAEGDEVRLSEEEFQKLAQWIEKAHAFVPEVGILAWDMARYVHLVRLCFFAGLFGVEDAWQRLHEAGSLVEGRFQNWNEFAQSFLIGRTFWLGHDDIEIKSACERLLGNPASPWRFVPVR